jgi:Pectinacetylesterase
MSGWRHRSRRVGPLALALFLACCALPASAQDASRAKSALPGFSELQAGWNVLRPGGETKCAKGGEYAFSVRPGAKDKLLVWFEGGGACWDEDCVRERFYRAYFENRSPARNQGIFDSTNAANPFSEYSAVIVRYCTGDIHLGDRDATYTLRDETGESRQFTIHHRGQVNAMAVLRWVHENFPSPRDIFVSGTSGGSYPTPFYASLLARHYPQARVVALADFGGHRGVSLPAPDNNQWGFPGVVRRHPGWERFPDNWNMSDFFITAARSEPRLQLLQFNHAYDANARFRLRQLGRLDADKVDMLAILRADQDEITRQVPSFRYFTVGGRGHGALPQNNFYIYATGGRLFRDWVADAAAGRPVPSVDCTDCSRPEFPFSERDLRIVERALALVSTPGAWNADDAPQQCGPKLVRYSLNCALRTAVNEIAPGANAAGAWEVVYSAIAKMGTYFDDNRDELEERGVAPALALQLFNNRPGTTVKDVISLLEEARDRIRVELRRKAK